MVKNNGEWKAKKDEFQGYMKKGIDGIEKRLDRHDLKFDMIFTKISDNEKVIERLKVKMSIIATAAGAIAAFIFNWIRNMWR